MRQMAPDEVLKLLEGVPDVITPAVEQRRKFFSRIECPSCGGQAQGEVLVEDIRRLRADEVIPYGRARCNSCGCLFDPDTKVIYEKGDVLRVLEPAYTLIDPDKE